MIRLQYLLTLVIFLSASYGQLTVSDKIHNQIQERENASAIMKNSQATKNYYAYIISGGKKFYIRKIFPSDKTRKFSSFYIKYEKQKETFSYIKYGKAMLVPSITFIGQYSPKDSDKILPMVCNIFIKAIRKQPSDKRTL